MDTKQVYRELFANLVSPTQRDFDLAKGALYIAAEDSPTVNVEESTTKLDDLAEEVREHLKPSMDLNTKLKTLGSYLGETQGYSDDVEDQFNPDNLYLDQVLSRRKGMTIALSLVYMEVGARLGMLFEIINLPNRLVIRTPSQGEDIYLDPHRQGEIITREECGKLTEEASGQTVHLSEEFFKPCTKRQLLVNLLSNLKMMHVRRRDYSHAIAAADRVALLDPYMGSNLKERAWMFYRTHSYAKAIEDLETYLDLNPVADDADSVRAQIKNLWDNLASMN